MFYCRRKRLLIFSASLKIRAGASSASAAAFGGTARLPEATLLLTLSTVYTLLLTGLLANDDCDRGEGAFVGKRVLGERRPDTMRTLSCRSGNSGFYAIS